MKEVNGLLRRGAFEIVMEKEVPKSENFMGGRLVLAIKNIRTNNKMFKARFVVQVHLC